VPLRIAGWKPRAARARAEELLRNVGLGDRLHHRPGKLSGGQQQRVAIARAITLDAPVILADEPTAHLDHVQVEGILNLLREIAAPGRTVLVATHDDRMSVIADRAVDLAPIVDDDSGAGTVELAAGEVLFRQGDRGHLVYEVERGEVELLRDTTDGEELIRVAVPGDYFGELGPILGLPRSATARARTAAAVIGFSVHEFRRRRPHKSATN
jgi:putative ABC transport system ATP-binding protein